MPNANNAQAVAIYAAGGTPFSPQFIRFNSPNLAQCDNPAVLRCAAGAVGLLSYLNYSPDALNNFSFRPEYYHDPQGQRTGTKANYYTFTFGWQHWFSPQLEVRPDVGYWGGQPQRVQRQPEPRHRAEREPHFPRCVRPHRTFPSLACEPGTSA